MNYNSNLRGCPKRGQPFTIFDDMIVAIFIAEPSVYRQVSDSPRYLFKTVKRKQCPLLLPTVPAHFRDAAS